MLQFSIPSKNGRPVGLKPAILLKKTQCQIFATACSYHVTYAFLE